VEAEDIARELSNARKAGVLIEPPSSRYPGFTIQDGYAVGRLLDKEARASGAVPAGLKLGFTNRAVWASVGLDSPFWSPIYESTVVESRSVSLNGLVGARIEPEIVIGFRADLAPDAEPIPIADSVAWAALGFEIVQCHYPDWRMTPADAIADAGLHGMLVIGDRIHVSADDALSLADVAVDLCQDRVTVATGTGANALGGPMEAVQWLLRLPGVQPLQPGSVVTTGTLTSAMAIAPGQTWELVAEGPVELGRLELAIV
jgi:2-oxo-3-hexenedioate decarboxylase